MVCSDNQHYRSYSRWTCFILTVVRDFDPGMGQGILGKSLWFPQNIVFAEGLVWEKVHFNVISMFVAFASIGVS